MICFHELFDLCQGHVLVYVNVTENIFMMSPDLICLHHIDETLFKGRPNEEEKSVSNYTRYKIVGGCVLIEEKIILPLGRDSVLYRIVCIALTADILITIGEGSENPRNGTRRRTRPKSDELKPARLAA